ncbi:MAG: PrsW family glutamic-type intramembrane protease [Ktedonobacterales bacterium]
MRCPNCGRETPAGEYCVHCGARLPTDTQPVDARRTHAYAANPHEHVLHLSVVTTLFPHLTPRQSGRARWLLLGSAVVIFCIGLARLVPLAVLLGALLVPVLYLAYFYVAELYEDEPLPVLVGTFVAGAVFGTLVSLGFYHIILSQRSLAFGSSASYVLLTGVALPLLSQALMLVGPLVLYVTRPQFDHLLDGLSFGAASGLGFAAAQSLIYSWLLIQGPFRQTGPDYSWALPILRIAIVVPLLDATTTGLICAALWLRRDRQADVSNLGWLAAPPVAALLGVLGQIIPSLGYNLIGGQIMALLWYGVAAAVFLILLRLLIHDGLLEEARTAGPGAAHACPYCQHMVPADGAFCPHCGLAQRPGARRRPPQPAPAPNETRNAPSSGGFETGPAEGAGAP